jgi:hypothetical protein
MDLSNKVSEALGLLLTDPFTPSNQSATMDEFETCFGKPGDPPGVASTDPAVDGLSARKREREITPLKNGYRT